MINYKYIGVGGNVPEWVKFDILPNLLNQTKMNPGLDKIFDSFELELYKKDYHNPYQTEKKQKLKMEWVQKVFKYVIQRPLLT